MVEACRNGLQRAAGAVTVEGRTVSYWLSVYSDNVPGDRDRVSGDRRGYFISDVIVIPEYQCQKIGSALMERALVELRKIGPKGAFVGLFTPKPIFYERLGFQKDIGMHIAL